VPIELVFCSSKLIGEPVRVATSATYLGRALALGFQSISAFGPEAALQASDDRRHFVWMPFSKETVLLPDASARRIVAPTIISAATAVPARRARPSDNGSSATQPVTKVNPMTTQSATETKNSAIDEATAVRTALRDAITRTNELVR